MQRILIVENELLLGAGIQHFLSDEVDLEIIGISPGNGDRLSREISRLQPDVIILDEASQLACPTILQALSNRRAKLRILLVSANHNLVRIYSKQEFQEFRLNQAADFSSFLRENKVSDQIPACHSEC